MTQDFTIEQMAERLDLSVETLLRWINDGRLVLEQGEWYFKYPHMPRRRVADLIAQNTADQAMFSLAQPKSSERIVRDELEQMIEEHGLEYLESLIDLMPIGPDDAWLRNKYLPLKLAVEQMNKQLIEDSIQAVKGYLVRECELDESTVMDWIERSDFKKALLKDPDFVNHWTTEVWAEEVFKQFAEEKHD